MMRKGVNVSNLSRAEWLEERRKGIGGSDAAAVAGLNPWRSAAAVYLDKVGEVEPENKKGRQTCGNTLSGIGKNIQVECSIIGGLFQ